MGAVIPFPASAIIRQAPEAPEVIWFSGGSLHASNGGHVRHMEPHIALERREFWARQCLQLGCDPSSQEARLAARRWGEITKALDHLENHCRAVGKPGPYAPDHVRNMLRDARDLEAALASQAMEQP